ncbi:MAG: terminase small subunit [Acidobacteriota bacterium]|nr:terminase small subunit [Acidobacteriota bacterium]
MAGSLTEKQRRFVEEYLVDLNATQAAIRAGYSEKTATVIGHENLTKPHIKALSAEIRAEQTERTPVDADMVIEGLLAEARNHSNPGSVRVSAWSWIGKHLAMFTDKVEVTERERVEIREVRVKGPTEQFFATPDRLNGGR